MARLIDANVVLRYFLNDLPEQADAAEKLFRATKEKIILTDLVVAEIVWVLQSIYKLPKDDIVKKIDALINLRSIDCNYLTLERTLTYYSNHNISFIDAHLLAYSEEEKLEGIYSFDEDLDQIKSIKRFKP